MLRTPHPFLRRTPSAVRPPPPPPPRGPARLVALAVPLALLLGACGSDGTDATNARAEAPEATGSPDASGAADDPRPGDGGDGVVVAAPDAPAQTPAEPLVDAVPDVPPGPDAPSPGPSPGPSPEPDDAPGDGPGTATGADAGPLGPLPFPPLTPPPGASSEPVLETDPVSALGSVFLVRDPQGRIVDTDAPGVTDADFEAGPLPAVVTVLNGADVTGNTPPDFAGLDDVEAFAGELVEVLLRPVDPDGGLAGMYPERLPAGSEYRDNLDGTRTLRWRPLQPDVGIEEFTMVAVDPVEPALRTARTVRIRVRLPADQSGIPNLPPGINRVRDHVARVGDPVVVRLKGTDPNGTTPELGVENPPPGATFVAHPTEPGMRVLRFVPSVPGTLVLRVVATDVENRSLVARTTVTIDVREPEAFERPGERLRDLAPAAGVRMGYAALQGFYHRPDGALYADVAAAEYDFVTTENQLKPDLVNPLPGVYRFAAADNLVAWARTADQAVHGHTLVWHRQLPGWLKRTAPATREGHMREYIDRVVSRYRDEIPVWDVVNEVFEDDGSFRDSIWHEAMGEGFVDVAFRQARASDPDAILLYNDYDVAYGSDKPDAMFRMLEGALARGVPIDGVGFQLHVFARFDGFEQVRRNFARAARLGLDVYVTELDVSMAEGDTETMQAAVYEELLSICLEQPRCRAFQSWGFTDMYSWRRQYSPLPLDAEYAAKPAYLALQERLARGR